MYLHRKPWHMILINYYYYPLENTLRVRVRARAHVRQRTNERTNETNLYKVADNRTTRLPRLAFELYFKQHSIHM